MRRKKGFTFTAPVTGGYGIRNAYPDGSDNYIHLKAGEQRVVERKRDIYLRYEGPCGVRVHGKPSVFHISWPPAP